MSILEDLISEGVLVEPTAVNMIQSLDEKQAEFLMKMDPKPLFLNKKILEAISNPVIDIVKDSPAPDKISVQDLVNDYNNRYNVLQKALFERLNNPSSISGLSRGECSIVGLVSNLVKEGTDLRVTMEDPTGRIDVVFRGGADLREDDVVGIHGYLGVDKIMADSVSWPELSGSSKRSDVPAVLCVKGSDVPGSPFTHSVSFEDGSGLTLNVGVRFRISGFNFLILDNADMKNALKRGHASGKVLDPIPDVVIMKSSESSVDEYGNVIVIGSGGKNVYLNLETRKGWVEDNNA